HVFKRTLLQRVCVEQRYTLLQWCADECKSDTRRTRKYYASPDRSRKQSVVRCVLAGARSCDMYRSQANLCGPCIAGHNTFGQCSYIAVAQPSTAQAPATKPRTAVRKDGIMTSPLDLGGHGGHW